ncbi:MCE family protein [Gordonia humi]|uniref:Phospholipid/cholesterol/gamma-HCH transport system substrate-binding protein n=1 Tax=Gordonia humi TaxID=686429 RepID=A0A840EW11_9ACTN|nr:phospholipid/cholesterol/gamma-HCH transport system substrate-binding protein [Gordonia humi]
MDKRARAFRATVIKLGTFVVVMVLVLVGLVVVFSKYQSGGSNTYRALFTSASSMKSGSSVQIAGVEVGTVKSIDLTRDNTARIEFTVNENYRLPKSARALVRYQNLTGDRYLELQPGAGDLNDTLAPGDEIGIDHTEPALDLDKLLGGFKPLFRTMDADEVNQLSSALIAVFQGQGRSLNALLESTSSFTNSLADRDQLIGSVIDNLNTTLGTLEADHKGLDQSVDRLQQLISGLAEDKDVIGRSITQSASATTGLADLMGVIRPDTKKALTDLGTTSANALKSEDFIRDLLGRLPGDFKRLSNLGSYGSWLQIYFCRIRLLLPGPGKTQYYFTAIDAMGDKTQAGGRCAQ